jgi:hypothetical protein
MIEAARRELGERAVYVVADVRELPFPADSILLQIEQIGTCDRVSRRKVVSGRRLSDASDDGMAAKAIRPLARFTPDGPGYGRSRSRTRIDRA